MAERLPRFTLAEAGHAAVDVETGELFRIEEVVARLPWCHVPVLRVPRLRGGDKVPSLDWLVAEGETDVQHWQPAAR